MKTGTMQSIALAAMLVFAGFSQAHAEPVQCESSGVQLQVLGSGGPIADDGRASSGYLVWVDGESRVMIDVGGGTFLRFGEAGASFTELEHIGLSHFHTDHSADFITLLKTGFFSDRERPLSVSGPGAGGPFPGLTQYLAANLGDDGAYKYLGGYLDGTGGLVRLNQAEIDPAARRPLLVDSIDDGEITVHAIGVPHGIVPALGYKVEVAGRTIVFSTDQNGSDDSFIDFARGADILVMHMVIPENAGEFGRALHAVPSRIGEIAAAAEPGLLLLSHLMGRSLANLEDNVGLIRDRFDGTIVTAEDLLCQPL